MCGVSVNSFELHLQSEISVCHHPHIVASIASVDSDDSGGFSSRPPVVRRHSSAARLSALENTRLRVKSDAEDLAALIVTNRRRSQVRAPSQLTNIQLSIRSINCNSQFV